MTFTQWLIDNDAIKAEEDESVLSAKIKAKLKAQFDAEQDPPKDPPPNPHGAKFEAVLAEQRKERERVEAIDRIAAEALHRTPTECDLIEKMVKAAHDDKSVEPNKFEFELFKATLRAGSSNVPRGRDSGLTNKIIEAAICQAGRLGGHEKMFDDRTLQAAQDQFPNGIGLRQLILLCAEANGYNGRHSSDVTIDAQRAAFGMIGPQRIQASGFSTLNITNVLAATANKFMHEGWMAVDMTPMRISAIKNVRDFKTHTTVSLTGDLQYDKVSGAGEIPHGTLADLTYTNKADTYARMLAITRQDIINDDLGALTAVPRRLGRGAALKLNDIFWTEFLGLVSAGFFASGNNNINTGVADMTIGGLEATETIFMNQTDPDGKPLGIMPKIVLVPTALKAKATALLDDQRGQVLITGASATIPAANVFNGRFRVESSPYISNTTYTGNTSTAWWMLADPNELAVIEIAALNGRVEPVVETADADFNVLGIQMRGYSDIGVNEQEKRAGVHADGGSS